MVRRPRRAVSALLLALVLALLPACSDGGTSPDPDPSPNAAPVATIHRPLEGATFHAGDRVSFTGSALDAEDGAIPASRLSWWADLHHDDHTHPFLVLTTGVDSGAVTIPTRGETSDNIWYRFYLVATDLQGAADTVHREIFPEKATMRFETQPAGLRITLDGQPMTTPLEVVGVVGLERDLGVVSPQTHGDSMYTFESWAHGGDASQTIVTPAGDSTYTAIFSAEFSENLPPIVSLTAPAPGSEITVHSTVPVTASASDADGTVVEVRFHVNGGEIGVDSTSPYGVPWTPTTTGVHRLFARATDDAGATATSDTVDVIVVQDGSDDSVPPTVQLTAPADLAQDLTGPLTLSATASDNVGVAGVQFQIDGVDFGAEVIAPPYEVELPSTAAYASGVHVIRARARDAAGNVSDWSSATVSFGGSEALAAGFQMAPYGAELPGLATALAFAPDGRLFVTLKNGSIRVLRDGTLLGAEFARITVDEGGERGLIGLAFHPDFATTGWVYVHYVTPVGDASYGRVARLVASGDTAAAGGAEVLVTFPENQNIFHNGGAIAFGPDGRLYVAVGDDATPANSQDMGTTYGKLLRFADDGTIPSDNPFFGSTSGLNRSIWALGLRNPYTFAFHPGTGRLLINDVGGSLWEEINEGIAGANYGWPETEGPTNDSRFTSPIFAYQCHQGMVRGCSIVGAAFYDPPTQAFPASYIGHYFFGDYVRNWIHRLDPENGNAVYRFATLPGGITGLAVGPDGAVYVLVAHSFSSSQVYRISYSP